MRMSISQILSNDVSEDQIAALVDRVKQSSEDKVLLVELLSERLPLYAGRSSNQTLRIRGYILATFEQIGLPDAAFPFVLEELESGHEAYLVAAAARAVRGLNAPTNKVVPFLLKAVHNI